MDPSMKIAVIQFDPIPLNVQENAERMCALIVDARNQGAHIVVFPEFSISAYLLGDEWENDTFIEEIQEGNRKVARATKGTIAIWGSVVSDKTKIGEDGRLRKYNAAIVAQNGHIISNGVTHFIPKTNLPKYRIFDDARHFYPATSLATELGCSLDLLLQPYRLQVNGKAVRLAVTICEDLWDDEYNTKPAHIYGRRGADLMVCISQSPWTAEKWHAREGMLRRRYQDAMCPILYVNAVGLQNNVKNLVWFDGDSCYIGEEGMITWRAPRHKAGLYLFDPSKHADPVSAHRPTGIAEIYEAIIYAKRAYFGAFPKVVFGVSGGIDSAVSAALTVQAIGRDKVLAINMPTQFNSQTTQDLAAQFAANLGIEYRSAPIENMFVLQLSMLARQGYVNPSSLVKENIQARARGQLLAAIAAAEGGVFVANGNKTEVALNYFTLYGDGAGAVAFLADLWKGQIYELARYINAQAGRELIPQGIIDIIPSAELSAEQNVDQGKGDPIYYPYHDHLLRAFSEWRWDPYTVLQHWVKHDLEQTLRCAPGTLQKYFPTRRAFIENLEWAWRQYCIDWKRGQLPPVFLVSRHAFGFDRRSTIADAYFTAAYRQLRDEYLSQAA